ncbi:MAG: hypothetical protein M1831_002996 [Alyxoria varia]|nr:MAG: hypothetical protein M1831_002996 [Alyxoria varia]
MISEIKRIIKDSEIMKEDDTKWPQKNKDGRQELEIRLGNDHISFETAKIGSLVDVTESQDPEGLRVFYYLVQDLKALVFSLISLHFKRMPTPDDEVAVLPSVPATTGLSRTAHATCPPEDECAPVVREDVDAEHHRSSRPETLSGTRPSTRYEDDEENTALASPEDAGDAAEDIENRDRPLTAGPSMSRQPQSNDEDHDENHERPSLNPLRDSAEWKPDRSQSAPSVYRERATVSLPDNLQAPEMPSPRACNPMPQYTSSFLRHGSKFTGTQMSDKQVYNVEVELKYVDMSESFLCGYLKIEGTARLIDRLCENWINIFKTAGLTPDHDTLTTYFEGEIVGTKYTFETRHPEWGSNEKVDMQHWNRFAAWRPLARQARRPDFSYKDYAEREHIFMRWKEHFLVPDHRIQGIHGASFEGFYYICFNQRNGTVKGIYFHSKSEKYQQLELKHVDDRGCFGVQEFR